MLENTDRKLLWLWLDVAFGPADKRLWDVMSYYDSVEEMCDDLLSLPVDMLLSRRLKR